MAANMFDKDICWDTITDQQSRLDLYDFDIIGTTKWILWLIRITYKLTWEVMVVLEACVDVIYNVNSFKI